MLSDRMVITVDVECDSDGGPTWRYSDPLTFEGVTHGIGEALVPILKKVEGRATLLISNVVLGHDGSCSLLLDLPSVELGGHLHGDYLEPHPKHVDPAGTKTVDNQCDYPEGIERVKLENYGRLFEERFGRAPRSFRAGRWSASGRTTRLLAELGYIADSSVTPHVRWTDGGRDVDHREAPQQPYHPSGESISERGSLPIWELPVSIVRSWRTPRRALWLRPSLSKLDEMKRVVSTLRRRTDGARTFVMMFHNNELTAGASPYSKDPDAAREVAARLEGFLQWARDDGMEFVTLSEAAARCES